MARWLRVGHDLFTWHDWAASDAQSGLWRRSCCAWRTFGGGEQGRNIAARLPSAETYLVLRVAREQLPFVKQKNRPHESCAQPRRPVKTALDIPSRVQSQAAPLWGSR